ncbi:MAG: AmmeMemoRadiSam system protein A [Planctomycetota bacterium]
MATDPLALTAEDGRVLLALARRAIAAHVRKDRSLPPADSLAERRPALAAAKGVFVTIEAHGDLRGCIGDLSGRRPLAEGVPRAAVEAAAHDLRFPPVTASELDDLVLTVTVLEPSQPIEAADPAARLAALVPGQDGVILEHGGRRSTFLPQVWRQIPDPEEFLRRLSIKLGGPPDVWRSPDARLYRYRAVCFGEEKAGE